MAINIEPFAAAVEIGRIFKFKELLKDLRISKESSVYRSAWPRGCPMQQIKFNIKKTLDFRRDNVTLLYGNIVI